MGKEFIVIHHTAGGRKQTAAEIKAFIRTGRPDLGGSLAYAKIIEPSGKVVDDAPEASEDVAHCKGYNRKGIGVAVIGWFDPGHDKFDKNDPAYKALVQTCVVLCRRHHIKPINIIGHCDSFVLRGVSIEKSCPGEFLYKLLPDLRKEVAAYL